MSTTRRRRNLLLSLALLVGLLLLPAAPAWAHATLLQVTPANQSVIAASPPEVALHFDQPVSLLFGSVKVLAPDGTRVDTGKAKTRDGQSTVATALQPNLSAGTYTILWRVVSADTHVIFGAETFSVGAASATSAAVSAQEQGSNTSAKRILDLARMLLYAGIVIFFGGWAFILVLWPAGQGDRRASALLRVGWCAAVLGTVTTLCLQVPYATGQGLSTAFDPASLGGELGTRLGIASLIRLVLLVIAALLLRYDERLRQTQRLLTAAALALGVFVSIALVGHGGSGGLVLWALPTDLLHIGAACAWLGGLAVLAVTVLDDKAVAARMATVTQVLPRWSRYATATVGILVLSGLFAGWRQVREIGALTATDYGRLLILKTALVVLMLGAAAVGRTRVQRRIQQAPQLRALRRLVLGEAAVGVIVLVVTSLLVGTSPARESYFPTFSQSTTLPAGLRLHAEVRLARVGLNTLELRYTAAGGAPTDIVHVSARWTAQHGAIVVPVTLTGLGLGRYEARSIQLPAVGTWQLAVMSQTSDIDSATTLFTVRIR